MKEFFEKYERHKGICLGKAGTRARPQRDRLPAGALALILACALVLSLVPSVAAKSAQAATGNWVSADMPEHLTAKYGSFHTVVGGALPDKYNDYARVAGNMLYYSTTDNHTVYCIEIDQHVYSSNPYESTSPPSQPDFSSTAKQNILTYLLAKGERFHRNTEESVKRQTATQLAVWLLSDDLHENQAALEAVCGSEEGAGADADVFAPTAEVGTMTRRLLSDAKAYFANGGDVAALTSGVPPSFASLTEADAPVHEMEPSVGSLYRVSLEDTTGSVANDWPEHLRVIDSDGLSQADFTQNGNILIVSGQPQEGREYLVRIEGLFSGNQVRFLDSDDHPGGDPERRVQRMARLAQLDGLVPAYFKLRIGTGTEPPDPPDPPDPGFASLALIKRLTGEGADSSKAFEFTAHFRDAADQDVTGVKLNGQAYQDGSAFVLRAGEQAVFTEIPLGTSYTVLESPYQEEGYTSDKPDNTAIGKLGSNQVVFLNWTNTFTSIKPPDPPNPPDPPKPPDPTNPGTPGQTTPGPSDPKPLGKPSLSQTADPFPLWPLAPLLGIVALVSIGVLFWIKRRG
ncbi:MAG: DUF5979 domain-containing protein [Coriobacteriaceae bacterium]|nr:DUF5979 domain-containing protein [Coriobacteriaceae bacterium]